VVGGNYIVGLVVFFILVIIQFVVITNGAGRVAEVAARFTLDAMPGKQMSIDADLNAGIINEHEARQRRRLIEREADFYGAMDGASKFVKGDAIAGVIIIIINIVGGLAIGAVQLGMPIGEAVQTYTLLTIGDGLVTQIPALLISTATGIMVTRAASESNLGRDVASQILANPRALAIVSGLLLALAAVPGLPKLPFFAIGAMVGALAYALRSQAKLGTAEAEAAQEGKPERAAEDFSRLLQVDPMELEVGFGLISLVDVDKGGNLLDRVGLLRRQMAMDLGIILPTIRIRDNMRLSSNSYVIKLRGVRVAEGEVRVERFLAMNPGLVEEPVQGIEAKEPAFGLPAVWVTAENKERAETLGYTVVDPTSVIITHLSEVIKTFSAAIISRQDVQTLVNNVKAEYPAVVEELIPNMLSLGHVHKVLRNLLRERVSVRDLVTILETLANYAPVTTDADLLSEHVRQALARSICAQVAGEDGSLHVIVLGPTLQQRLAQSVQQTEQGMSLAIEPAVSQKLIRKLAAEMEKLANNGHDPVLICQPSVRLPLRRLIERSLPTLTVLSYNEIASQVNIHASGRVDLDDKD
ncbi:MAG: FHIPEP family type III secretion protein, partial [Chloroflexi bacterium]|nr:FHIPEP family type III secretion protein [Chloroflexota bacterium]